MNGHPIASGFNDYKLQITANPDIFLVERIIGGRKFKGNLQFKGRWLGFKDEIWIDVQNIV